MWEYLLSRYNLPAFARARKLPRSWEALRGIHALAAHVVHLDINEGQSLLQVILGRYLGPCKRELNFRRLRCYTYRAKVQRNIEGGAINALTLHRGRYEHYEL